MTETRPRAGSVQAPVIASPSIASSVAPTPGSLTRGACISKFCRRKNWPGRNARACAGARTTTSTIVGVSRCTACTVGANSSRQRAIRSAPDWAEAGVLRASSVLTTG